MSSLSSETAHAPIVNALQKPPGSRTTQMDAEDVARTLVRLQMRIRDLEAELTALRATPGGWR